MNKENEIITDSEQKCKKNANTKTQPPITEAIKETRGRKAGAQIPGIISNNEGVIKR